MHQSGGEARILLITPPPIHEPKILECQKEKASSHDAEFTGLPERTNEVAGEYAETCVQVAKECNVRSLNLHKKMQESCPAAWPKFLIDGLHLSDAGNEFTFNAIMAVISQHWPELSVHPDEHGKVNSGSTSDLLPEFPWHDWVDPLDLETTLDVGNKLSSPYKKQRR